MSPVIHDESVLKAVKDLAPGLTERSREIEVERTLPTDLVSQLREARVFGLMTPASLGGLEAEPSTIVSVIEELTRADASAGWTAMIGQGAGYLAWLDRDVAKAIVEDNPRPVILGS